MKELFEKIYSADETEKKDEKTELVVEILKEDWQTMKIIAKIVGGDFGMEIKLGEPGSGSFFNPENGSITFDPLHIKNNLEQAKFVAGHEGSHRAISSEPKKIGLSPEKISELYSQIGFGYLQNVIEDPAANNWMTKRFPGLKPYTEKIYNEQLKEENVVLSTPETQIIASQLGYWPKFMQYGSEIIRDWHQNKFSTKLDPLVEKALKRTIKLVRESISIIPEPQKSSQNEKEIITAAQKRFENNTNYIWPEVKKLVEMDFYTERQRQTLRYVRQKQKELGQRIKEMEQAKKDGDKQKQEELQKKIEELEKELAPFNDFPEDVKKELQEQTDKVVKEAIKELNKKIEEKQKQVKEAKQRQEELNKEIKDLEEKAKSTAGKEKEKLEKQIQEKKIQKLKQEIKQKQAEQKLKDIQDALENLQSGKQMSYPEDKFSEEIKQELEKLFNKLPSQKQKEIKEKAEKQLEDLEDTINKEMQGKLNGDELENHRERRERQKREEESAEKITKAEEERERIVHELERMRQEKMTPYERARTEVVGMIDNLYFRLRRILKPEEYGGEETGHLSGQLLDIKRAMQSKKDFKQKYKLWIKESAPEKRNYRFWHLIDVSGSMSNEKINETFKGFIVAGEAIDRIENLNSETIDVRQGITGFHNKIFPYKEPNQRFNKTIEDNLSTMPARTRDDDSGTDTYSATVFALKNLKENLGQTGNFLLTFTDGAPNYDIRDNLKELLKKGREERERLNIKVGLVWLGESSDEEKLDELVKEYGYNFGLIMSAVKPSQKAKDKRNFSEKLADLLESIVKNPEKY